MRFHRIGRLAWSGSLLLAIELPSCGGRTNVKEEPNGTYAAQGTMPLDRAQGRMEAGKQARMEGRFADAAGQSRAVLDNRSVPAELRAEALFEFAQVYADLLNPKKDNAKAIACFERLPREFPDSKCCEPARRRIEEVRKPAGTEPGE